MAKNHISVYISYLLRHNPAEAGLDMDSHGWVSVDDLIAGVNRSGKHRLDHAHLEEIVKRDSKGRYRFSPDHSKIKACQGHSIPWVQPELEYLRPPKFLYHGTTAEAAEKIMESGAISKMGRHAVHMQADPRKAWQSALRWRRTPVVLKIDAGRMYEDGIMFGKTENDVWCTQSVPTAYLAAQLRDPETFFNAP